MPGQIRPQPMRVYIDTSVWGGYFDEEFSAITVQFFEAPFAGLFSALVSDTLVEELIEAPAEFRISLSAYSGLSASD